MWCGASVYTHTHTNLCVMVVVVCVCVCVCVLFSVSTGPACGKIPFWPEAVFVAFFS